MPRRTSRRSRSLLLCLAVATATATTACGRDFLDGTPDPPQAPDPVVRGQEVAEAWEGSRAAAQWREGYHPMQRYRQLPRGGWKSAADERAYTAGRLVMSAEWPNSGSRTGTVRWEGGRSLDRPLLTARKSFGGLATTSGPGTRLVGTGVKLGTMRMWTASGWATVPAWELSIEGYSAPLKHAAVVASPLPKPPVEPAAAEDEDLQRLGTFLKVSADGRSITVQTPHGACDDDVALQARESAATVVLTGSLVGHRDGPCTAELILDSGTVRLDRPLGDRILLDAVSGRPVPYGERQHADRSWS